MADRLSLTFVIRGKSYTFEFAASQPLKAAISEVLGRTGNTGPAEWTARKDGAVLDQSKTLAELGLHDGDTIFLSTGPSEQGAA